MCVCPSRRTNTMRRLQTMKIERVVCVHSKGRILSGVLWWWVLILSSKTNLPLFFPPFKRNQFGSSHLLGLLLHHWNQQYRKGEVTHNRMRTMNSRYHNLGYHCFR